MAFDRESIKNLVVCAFKKTTPDPTKYSVSDVKGAASQALHELASDYNSYRRNKYDIFAIIIENADEIVL